MVPSSKLRNKRGKTYKNITQYVPTVGCRHGQHNRTRESWWQHRARRRQELTLRATKASRGQLPWPCDVLQAAQRLPTAECTDSEESKDSRNIKG